MAAFLQVSCQKNTEIIESTDDFRENAIHKISKLEYDIDTIYLKNFTDNLIFDGNGKVIGAMVEEIQASLEEKRYESFIQEVIKESFFPRFRLNQNDKLLCKNKGGKNDIPQKIFHSVKQVNSKKQFY